MKPLVLCLITFISSFSYSQKDFSKDVFIGTWKFIQLQDENGIKHTEIPMYFQGEKTVEIINRSDYIFFKNGDYKYSNKYASGGGKWYINKQNKSIELSLRILTDDPAFQTLLDYHVITKAKDGYYYQKPTSLYIESYSNDKLIIADNYPYVLIYRKIN